jgi:hypothetical protein
MHFHLREIVLWPRDTSLTPQRLSFSSVELNVISGVSRTGKSAVIPIVDYCLGSDTCQIPVTTIRDKCSWFGIIVATDAGEILLARREPGNQRSTSEMFVLRGVRLEPPRTIDIKNASVDDIKRTLDELAGLSQLDFDSEGTGAGFRGRPSFRDLIAFTFQSQNIVANQNVLFFKADTHEHREKLRTIFPYVLGAVTPATLAKQHELAQLKRELSRKEREVNALREISARWIAEIRGWASQARELGLIQRAVSDAVPITTVIDELRAVTKSTQQTAAVTPQAVDTSISELVVLEREESERSTALAQARRRLSEMEQLRDASSSHGQQLWVQRDRLKVADWLEDLHVRSQACPLCGKPLGDNHESLQPLLLALRELEGTASQVAGVPAAFDRELLRVGTELRRATEQLEGVRHRIRALSRASDAAKARQDSAQEASRFVGRLEQALEHYERLGDDRGLSSEVDELREHARSLEFDLRELDIAARTERALRRVSMLMQPLLPTLDVERPNDPVTLSISDLTVRVSGQNRDDYLWEIGSGSNWLSYHLSLLVALHKFWLDSEHSPVPSMLIIDQPSQVYFPKQLTAAHQAGIEQPYEDEDVEAVRKIFTALAAAVTDTGGKLQIIVLDHATDTVWGGVTPLHVAGEWRGGVKLVPDTWPS